MTQLNAPGRWANHTQCKVRRYHVRRQELILLLGGKCVGCGACADLQFDHIVPRTWVLRDKSRWTRIALYEREAKEGKLQLLCAT